MSNKLKLKVMKTILFICALSFSSILNAGVERTTCYFESGTNSLSSISIEQLKALKCLLNGPEHSQVIEINAYVDQTNNNEIGKNLSWKRVESLIEFLGISIDDITIRLKGTERIGLNFDVLNWDRADIYVYKHEGQSVDNSIYTDEQLPTFNKLEIDKVTKVRERTIHVDIESTLAYGFNKVTYQPILFEPGSYKIKSECESYLEDLYSILHENPDIKIHIRGHVCCGNRIIPSRRRAKKVYQFLVKGGIDKKRLSFKGYGNKIPVFQSENSSFARSANRRVDVIFTSGQFLLNNLTH